MRVILEASVLTSVRAALHASALGALIYHCVHNESHSLEVEPPDSPAFRQWREMLPELLRDELDLLLVESDKRQLRDPSTTVIRVADVAHLEWKGDVPRFPLDQAPAVLSRPLRVLVEGVNDESFLRTAVPSFYRERFEQWERQQLLKIEHRGGIKNLHHALEQECQHRERRIHLFVMFDSDARKPQEPSEDSAQLAELCEAQAVPHHPLQRRALDNYLPHPALERWLKQTQPIEFPGKWVPRLRAFRLLTDPQRHHYNMKNGLKRDREGVGLADIFDGLAQQLPDPTLLEEGFGSTVARAFREPIPEAWFMADGQKTELMALFEKMLRAA